MEQNSAGKEKPFAKRNPSIPVLAIVWLVLTVLLPVQTTASDMTSTFYPAIAVPFLYGMRVAIPVPLSVMIGSLVNIWETSGIGAAGIALCLVEFTVLLALNLALIVPAIAALVCLCRRRTRALSIWLWIGAGVQILYLVASSAISPVILRWGHPVLSGIWIGLVLLALIALIVFTVRGVRREKHDENA